MTRFNQAFSRPLEVKALKKEGFYLLAIFGMERTGEWRISLASLCHRASVYTASDQNVHFGLTLKWLAMHCHLPPKVIQVSVNRPRRSHGLPLSIPFS